MKKILTTLAFAALASLPRMAAAQTQTFTSVSSATWCYIQVSTLTPTRVDNFNGACEGLLAGRSKLRITGATATLHGGYDVTLSTLTTSAKYGEALATTTTLELDLSSLMKYYLMGEAGATLPKVLIEQFRPQKALTPRE